MQQNTPSKAQAAPQAAEKPAEPSQAVRELLEPLNNVLAALSAADLTSEELDQAAGLAQDFAEEVESRVALDRQKTTGKDPLRAAFRAADTRARTTARPAGTL